MHGMYNVKEILLLHNYCPRCRSTRGPCHYVTARHLVAEEGDGVQIRRVDANIVHKQSRRADTVWSSRLGIRRDAINSSP